MKLRTIYGVYDNAIFLCFCLGIENSENKTEKRKARMIIVQHDNRSVNNCRCGHLVAMAFNFFSLSLPSLNVTKHISHLGINISLSVFFSPNECPF